VHTHSPFASAAAVAGLSIPPLLDDQVTFLGGGIAVAPYALPGSEDLGRNAVTALGERQAVLLQNHGAVGVGRGIREALTACELLEKTAQVFFWARLLGGARELPPEAVGTDQAFFRMSAPAPE
jgi:L-fuculose-phosphate aldolase